MMPGNKILVVAEPAKELIFRGVKCPRCHYSIPESLIWKEVGSIRGSVSSPAKTRAVRRNAKLGGWPKGRKRKPGKRKKH
jgi:hypothetical protein